jgi:ribosomal protein S18 acetylase RimI-like enzyme
LKIALDPGQDVADAIEAGLTAFNVRTEATPDPIPVQVSVRDDAGKVIGGVTARVFMDTLYISTVWIDDSLRGQGHGRAMLEMVEAEGRRLGATHAWLYTASWQARPFYESRGYFCFGEMAFGAGRYHRYFMRKDL